MLFREINLRYFCLMQLRLPLFPSDCTMVSGCVGVCQKDDLVQYIVNGLPVYSHHKDDLQAFRFITSNFIDQNLCKKVEVQRAFHLTPDFVGRAYKKFKDEGEQAFFSKDNRHGYCHKIFGEKKDRIQKKLNHFQSVNSIAKEEGLRESAIRAAIERGDLIRLKKTNHSNLIKDLI